MLAAWPRPLDSPLPLSTRRWHGLAQARRQPTYYFLFPAGLQLYFMLKQKPEVLSVRLFNLSLHTPGIACPC